MTCTDETLALRLWTKVRVVESGCWEWIGGRQKRTGYGCIGLSTGMGLAHRAAWMVTFGPIPAGMCVCHTCDNPPCCNPDHLFLGTQIDNMADRQAKGRQHVTLSKAAVQQMKAMKADGMKQIDIAAVVGCSPAQVSRILNGIQRVGI